MREIEFKKLVRKRFKGWSESYEPGRGGGLGIPDLQLLIDGALIPVELKVGKILKRGGVQFSLRPVQLHWHRKFFAAGGLSLVVVSFEAKGELHWESLIAVVSNGWVEDQLEKRMTTKFKLSDHLIIRPEHDLFERMKAAVDFWRL